ncbi:MAG: hypothetical protein JXQ90_21915 [Cyclobacteriaceae bacterium]
MRVFIIGIILLGCNELVAQERIFESRSLNIGYVSDRYSKGFLLGIERGGFGVGSLVPFAGLEVRGAMNKQTSNVGLSLYLGQKWLTKTGIFIEHQIGLGLQLNRYVNGSLIIDSNRSVEQPSWRLAFRPHAGLGIGYDFSAKNRAPLALYVRPGINLVVPDQNLVFKTSGFLQMGVLMNISN